MCASQKIYNWTVYFFIDTGPVHIYIYNKILLAVEGYIRLSFMHHGRTPKLISFVNIDPSLV